MPTANDGISVRVLCEFHGLCNHAYEAWVTHRTLFDDNPRKDELATGPTAHFFARLSEITQVYLLQQIAKLHDPAVQQGRLNLTLEYMIRFGAWDASTTVILEQLRAKLDELATLLKELRNRAISHNDLESILENRPLGGFPADADKLYFERLQDFVNTIAERLKVGPMPFNMQAEGDAFEFLKLVGSAPSSRARRSQRSGDR